MRIQELVPLSWRVAARKKQAEIMRRFDPNYRAAFVEDYVRVYDPEVHIPGDNGQATTVEQRNNFLNHQKFYKFVSQFSAGKEVLDAGCGSGHGCALLKDLGAKKVTGIDMSEHALDYARSHYARTGIEYARMSVTELQLPAGAVDVVTCSEVLEHVLEFGAHYKCMKELHRVLRPGGVAVMATPNAEMLPNHGYRFEQLRDLVAKYFEEFCFFENAFAPFLPEERQNWEERRQSGNHGVVAPWKISIEESCVPPEYDLGNAEHVRVLQQQVKTPATGKAELGGKPINVQHLHNTHSFLVVARKSAN